MPTSPTQRTLRQLREAGWTAQVVEQWIAMAKIRRDLFEIIDILAIDGRRVLGIQATSAANLSARVRKIREDHHDVTTKWLSCGCALEVWGWRKYRRPRSGRWWHPRIAPLVLRDGGVVVDYDAQTQLALTNQA